MPRAIPRTRPRLPRCLLALALAAIPAGPSAAGADEATSRDVKTYCANIAVAASDARIAWQTGRLNELEGRIKASIQILDAKTAELRGWAEKRAEIEKKAGEKLVGIYAKMRPETAAVQISTLDDEMAAAVLTQLAPRQAGAIFNEIVPERAAKLAALIAGAGPPPEKKL